MTIRRACVTGLAALLAACAGGAGAADEARRLSDHDIAAYAARPFDKRAMMFKHVLLGRRHGATVSADFACGDICPDDTRRIIHYDLAEGATCASVGGTEVSELIPRGPAVMPQTFCEPTVIAKPR
jgi:hypothetical protein